MEGKIMSFLAMNGYDDFSPVFTALNSWNKTGVTVKSEDTSPMIAKDVPKEELERVLSHHIWAAMGTSLVPVPIFDLVAITGIQINLLRALTKLYGLPFTMDAAKKFIASLTASVFPVAVAPRIALSLIKAIPLVGQTIGVVTMPILSGAATYALGKVFIQHFASGGTFLTFDPDKVKAYYAQMFAEGQHAATEVGKAQGKNA